MGQRGRLLLSAQGLNTIEGYQLIKNQIRREVLGRKKIYIFYEPYYSIEKKLVNACRALGFSIDHIILSTQDGSVCEIEKVDYIYVTEGNTFCILKILQERKLLKPIREAVLSGTNYIGASAGAVIAGIDIKVAGFSDKNEVGLINLEALGLIDGAVCPHISKKQVREIMQKGKPEFFEHYNKIYTIPDGKILRL